MSNRQPRIPIAPLANALHRHQSLGLSRSMMAKRLSEGAGRTYHGAETAIYRVLRQLEESVTIRTADQICVHVLRGHLSEIYGMEWETA